MPSGDIVSHLGSSYGNGRGNIRSHKRRRRRRAEQNRLVGRFFAERVINSPRGRLGKAPRRETYRT